MEKGVYRERERGKDREEEREGVRQEEDVGSAREGVGRWREAMHRENEVSRGV